MKAGFVARKPGVLAGIDCVRLAVLAMDPQASVDLRLEDGDAFEAGAVLAVVEAEARAFLSAERTALNLVGRLSGVATLTRAYVQAVAGTKARIADTRKTTPGLRALEKHAVACGGGINHRFGLDDAILIKDNHVAVCGGVAEYFPGVLGALASLSGRQVHTVPEPLLTGALGAALKLLDQLVVSLDAEAEARP